MNIQKLLHEEKSLNILHCETTLKKGVRDRICKCVQKLCFINQFCIIN